MIAIFGGGFDPIHNGHIACIQTALKQLPIEKLYLLPYAISPHKLKPFFSNKVRLRLLKLAIRDLNNVMIDTQEINQKQPNYTIDTLENLSKKYAGETIILLMGADSFSKLNTWKNYQKLANYCHIAVVNRPQHAIKNCHNFTLTDTSSLLHKTNHGLLFLMNEPSIELSSHLIRDKIKKKEALNNLLPDQLIKYLNGTHPEN